MLQNDQIQLELRKLSEKFVKIEEKQPIKEEPIKDFIELTSYKELYDELKIIFETTEYG